jgi:hypothetical protein
MEVALAAFTVSTSEPSATPLMVKEIVAEDCPMACVTPDSVTAPALTVPPAEEAEIATENCAAKSGCVPATSLVTFWSKVTTALPLPAATTTDEKVGA